MRTLSIVAAVGFVGLACASKQPPAPAAANAPAPPVSSPPAPAAAPAPASAGAPGSTAVATGADGTPPIGVTVLPAPPTPQPLPRAAQTILDDAAKATGGDAWGKHKNMRMKLELSFQGIGIKGQGERYATKGDKSLVVTDLPGIGVVREGTNGKVHWSQDPVNGLRFLEGAEAEQARIESVWNAEQRLAELYDKIEARNETGPGGVLVECVVLTPKLGRPTTNCYDPSTHLQVSQKGTRATPQGDTPFSSVLKDWREVGGVKMAFGVDTQAGPITFTGKISDVKFDVAMDDKMFEPPAPPKGDAPPAKAPKAGKPSKSKSESKSKEAVPAAN